MEWNNFSNFGRESTKKHFYKIILKSDHWPTMRCHLKVSLFLALMAIFFSGAEPFLQFWLSVAQEIFL